MNCKNLDLKFGMVGRSTAFVACLKQLDCYGRHDVPLLITGETGTGKELAARGAHYRSGRRDKPFVPVNCGAIPADLFVNEVFGHQRGAFTGADRDAPGLAAEALNGTLFLDEIDSLGQGGQVALLRFLQDGSFRRLGGGGEQRADIRVIAAANQNMEALAQKGRFREDLLYRLNVAAVEMPPLRERDGDVVLLARHFLRQFAETYDVPQPELRPEMVEWLRTQSWPGNVRQLENTLHRMFLKTELKGLETPRERCPTTPPCGSFNRQKEEAMKLFEYNYLTRLMTEVDGNVSEAARRAGRERSSFRRLLSRNGMTGEDFRPGDQ